MKRKILREEILEKPDLEVLRAFAEKLAGKAKASTLYLLSGDLGSGKTQFSRFFVAALGGADVMSPSFAIENQYQLKDFRLHHFDLYRLESDDEVESSGLWDSFIPGELVMVEWADRIDFQHWPFEWEIVQINLEQDHSLKLTHYAAAG